MRKTWLRNTLAALLTLAMVFGVVTVFGGEQTAKAEEVTAAAINETTVNTTTADTTPHTATISSVVGPTNPSYSWAKGGTNPDAITITGATDTASCTYTIAGVGVATLTCTVGDKDATGDVKLDKTVTITVAAPAKTLTAVSIPATGSVQVGSATPLTLNSAITSTADPATDVTYLWTATEGDANIVIANDTARNASITAAAGVATATTAKVKVTATLTGTGTTVESNICTITVNPAAVVLTAGDLTKSPATPTVGQQVTLTCQITAGTLATTGGATWGGTPTIANPSTSQSGNTVSMSYTPTAAGSQTVTLLLKDNTTPTPQTINKTLTFTVDPAAAGTLTVNPASAPVEYGKTYKINVTAQPTGTTSLKYTTTASASILTVDANNGTITGTGVTTTPQTITVTAYNAAGTVLGTANFTVTAVTAAKPTLKVTTPSTAALKIGLGKYAKIVVSSESDGDITWTSNNASICTVATTAAKENSAYGVKAGSTTITVQQQAKGNYAASDPITVSAEVFATSTALTVSPEVVSPAVGGTANFYITNTTNQAAIISSLDSTIATVNQNSLGGSGYITVTGVKKGTTYIQVSAAGYAAYVAVDVGGTSGTPTINLTFNPNIYALGYGGYTYMTIHVNNPVDRYVKITRDNLRAYVQDYNYSHPSQYVYWCTLDANNNATVLIRPQYSGTVSIMVDANGATRAYRTFTVTGYPTLPQTGPNYTAIYIVAGLCLATAATAVTMNVRKKRKEQA